MRTPQTEPLRIARGRVKYTAGTPRAPCRGCTDRIVTSARGLSEFVNENGPMPPQNPSYGAADAVLCSIGELVFGGGGQRW